MASREGVDAALGGTNRKKCSEGSLFAVVSLRVTDGGSYVRLGPPAFHGCTKDRFGYPRAFVVTDLVANEFARTVHSTIPAV